MNKIGGKGNKLREARKDKNKEWRKNRRERKRSRGRSSLGTATKPRERQTPPIKWLTV